MRNAPRQSDLIAYGVAVALCLIVSVMWLTQGEYWFAVLTLSAAAGVGTFAVTAL